MAKCIVKFRTWSPWISVLMRRYSALDLVVVARYLRDMSENVFLMVHPTFSEISLIWVLSIFSTFLGNNVKQ